MSVAPQIHKINNFPFYEMKHLKEESIQEGHYFLERLETDWANGSNQFDKTGEGLFVLKRQNKIIGIGGINQSPFAPPTSGIAFLNRFYISREERRLGYGTLLLTHLLQFAKNEFGLVQLKTNDLRTACFYENNGFEKLVHNLSITHQIEL